MKQNLLSILAIVISLISLFYGRIETMYFSQLIEKLASGQSLDSGEQRQLLFEARDIEQAAERLNSIVIPGSQLIRIDGGEFNRARIGIADVDSATITNAEIESATAGGGDVIIDETGVSIANNAEGVFSIKDAAGNRNTLYLLADEDNRLYIVNANAPDVSSGAGIWQRIKLTDGSSVEAVFIEDPNQDNRPYWRIQDGAEGIRLALGNDGEIDLRTEGDSGGSTFMRMRETTNTPPAGGTDAFHMYMKGDKLIIQFNAAGTAHYFYLDMTTTSNQSWVYSATAP